MTHQHLTALKNKTVVNTGASSGVGRAAALLFAQHGARVVLAARREEALNALVGEITVLGGKALSVPTDVTDAQAHVLLAACSRVWQWLYRCMG
jgi:NADP-dependent 3-hydroxy acid dehydrogenase YdfG